MRRRGGSGGRLITGLLIAGTLTGGCDRVRDREPQVHRLAVDVLADSGRSQRLRIEPPVRDAGAPPSTPEARVWLAQVSPARLPLDESVVPEPSPAALGDLPLPEPPLLAIDEDLKPPILREPAKLTLPRGARRAWVEIEVRVDEQGEVSDAMWVAGSEDSALVAAAVACAHTMRFYPALQGGRPLAVWCRQRFDVP